MDDTWYCNEPVGEKKLTVFMSELSKSAALSQIYTNHSIRATGATILSKNMHGPAQIMAVVDANTLGTFGFIGTTGSGTCCHTQVMQSGWTPVYWEVDLGAISIITRISITYRDTCKFLILI
jgi:hypothetical protein